MNKENNTIMVAGVALCEIEEGFFLRGSTSTPEESPKKEIYLSKYYIGKYPITNKQYMEFIKDTDYRMPPTMQNLLFNGDMQPVVAVSWYDANEYCKWFSQKNDVKAFLPTEAQWEKAARGSDGRTYPWGDSAPTQRRINVNSYLGKTAEVGSYDNASPYGCYDMLGNIWEWCEDYYDPEYYTVSEQENPINQTPSRYRAIRGGSWRSDLFRATCAHRCFYNPNVRSDRHGFRIVLMSDNR